MLFHNTVLSNRKKRGPPWAELVQERRGVMPDGKVRWRYIIVYVSDVTFSEYPTGFPRRRHVTMSCIHGGDSSVRCKS